MSHGTASHEAFSVAPYTAREIGFHLIGGVLNGAVTLTGLVWLISTWSSHQPSWLGIAAAAAVGVYLGDLVSGLLHWMFDTWFDETMAFVRRMVLQVREHHVYPSHIFAIDFYHDAGTLSWIALLLAGPVIGWAVLAAPSSAFAFYLVCSAVVLSVLVVFMLEFHKCGHRARNPRWVRGLQMVGLVLSVRHHIKHHSGNRDYNYCLINGWADHTLGRIGLFRALERAVGRWTGAVPQRNDREWLERFGRRPRDPSTTDME